MVLTQFDGGLGDLIAINLTITGNRANVGGGVFRESGPLPFKNSLVAGNFKLDRYRSDDISGTLSMPRAHLT